jgi:predicted transcriptional regulator
MSNINIVAVATLCDTALIILAEGVTIDDAVKNTANDKGINILSSKESAFTLASKIAELLP